MSHAAVVAAPRRIELRRVEQQQPPPGQVRIRVDGCGACGSDLPAWQGRPWMQYPMPPGAPGHEAWGRVEATGDGVAHLAEGQRVTGLFQGAFAETATAPAQHVVPVPDGVPEQPLPAEAVACAFNAAERADVHPGDEVAVVGVGFQGALLVRLARQAGARVTAMSRRAFACDVAADAGAHRTVQAWRQEDAHEVLGDAEGFDVVFEATGHQESLDLATDLLVERGRLIIAGYHQDPRTVNMQQWNWKGLDVINAHERDPSRYLGGMRKALQSIQDRELDLRRLVTHGFSLDEVDQAFEAMETREDGFLKGVVLP